MSKVRRLTARLLGCVRQGPKLPAPRAMSVVCSYAAVMSPPPSFKFTRQGGAIGRRAVRAAEGRLPRNIMDEPVVEVTARLVKCASPGSIRIQVRPPPDASVAASSSSSLVSHGRELLSGLLCKHASKLSELRQQVNECEHFNAKLHDDIWLLRFLLSHLPKSRRRCGCSYCAKETTGLAARKRDDNPSLPCGGPKSLTVPAIAKIYAALRDPAALSYYVPDPNRGTVLVAVPALIDFHAAAATMTDDESALAHRLSTEWLFRQCDAVTRRTGYLTKTIRCAQTAFRPARPAIRPYLAFNPRSPMRCM